MEEITLSVEQKRFIVNLRSLGVKKETLALMLMIIPGECQQRELARFLVHMQQQGVETSNEMVLTYLMKILEKSDMNCEEDNDII